jgi:hypothetical protein
MNTTRERIAREAASKSVCGGFGRHWARGMRRTLVLGLSGLALWSAAAHAEDTVCARVKIEIKQQLTLERQAFDAEMKINNTTDTGVIENVSVVVKVTDESGTPVPITNDPNDLSAKFYVRISNKQNISDVDGTGTVSPKTTSIIDWLLIPAPGAAGNNPLGKKYLVGATLRYTFGGEETVLDVAPDVITVKPLPLLTLDYFLTQDVWADDPLTPDIEPVEPFTLGVRVKNNGYATATNLKIDSAQPKIVENNQGLLINFLLTGSYVNDAPVQNTLLINFGDLAPNTSKMGRWIMETTLAGKFTEFTAKFSHADELGGTLTSILQATNAHFLIRDVRVDLPGRDLVRDFLARDGDVIRVYESDGPDTEVTDRSGVATLTAGAGVNGNATYRLTFPATAGFAYVKLPDPFSGTKALGRIVRSDAKEMLPENVWLSKTRNEQTKQWEYWINFFDVNSTGVYDSEFQAPPAAARPPVVQFIPDRVTKEGQQVSFLVEASSPDGKPLVLSAAPLPAGAKFTAQAPDPQAPGVVRAIFDWTPTKGSAGNYLISYSATDGLLSATRAASIKVDANTATAGPGMPAIVSPLSGAQVTSLKPTLSVQTSTNAQDPTTKVQFEVYADQAQTQLVATALVDKAVGATSWVLPANLNDNSRYWWRARAFDGTLYSPWSQAQFFVNTFNDPPDMFPLLSPASGAELALTQPVLSWASAHDKEGDAVTYSVYVYSDTTLNTVYDSITGVADAADGINRWQITKPLQAGVTYYWRVVAKDALGAETSTPARPFVVSANLPPPLPVLVSPAVDATVASNTVELAVQNVTDPEGEAVRYEFELDSDKAFASAAKRNSGLLDAGASTTSWSVSNLLENTWYYWRVRATDGHGDAGWQAGRFFVNAHNDAPALPSARNPGTGAWLDTRQPMFELSPAVDPEGDAVHYIFEISAQASADNVVVSGSSSAPNWMPPQALADANTYWWHYRVEDSHGASSAWSNWLSFSINAQGGDVPLSIQLLEPATAIAPQVQGGRRVVTLRWQTAALPGDASVSLYYLPTTGSASNSRIIEGLSWPAGTSLGSYTWDVTDLPVGSYRVLAQVHTGAKIGEAWAPGYVVTSNSVQNGKLQVRSGSGSTDETGKTWLIQVRLASAPVADVVVPLSSSNLREGVVQPTALTFTSQNWATFQNVTVKGVNDCVRDGNQKYWISFGKAQTTDPDYLGITAASIPIVNMDNGSLTQGCPLP